MKNVKGFELLNECTAIGTIPVKKYRSLRTGLTVIVAGVPGPLVNGYFFVATEALDDDGLPHTLEHLIFLGSAEYPYKGTLDILANRCLASGTNAMTCTDNTSYTVSTAGSEGFLNLLPIYLDHIFFPTLTDTGFITEVYHITGEGKDSGVVFCEMQSHCAGDSYVASMELQRALYKQNCGYRYETGGSVCNLRYSTNNENVRKFHKKFYTPLNSSIVVAGSVDIDKLLEICFQFEEKFLSKGSSKYEKAWQTPVEPLQKSVVRAVTYPCEEEDNGCVNIGWQGPSLVTEYYQVVACAILFDYLTQTSASPLMKYFVEINEPYCSSVQAEFFQNSTTAFILIFENVAIDKIPYIHEKLMELLEIIVNGNDESYAITQTRMISVIEKYTLEQLLKFEKRPQREIAMMIICDTLYGQNVEDLKDKLNPQNVTSRLANEPVSFWVSLLKEYFLCRPSATVLGYPWKNQQILYTQFESERLDHRKATFGEEGLKKKAEILEKAIAANDELPPDDLIASVPVPRADNFSYHSITRYTTDSEQQHPIFKLRSSPVFTHLDDIDTKFVYAYVTLDTRELPKSYSKYLSLFMEYILACPISRDGKVVSYEQVAAELENDLIYIKNGIGLFCDERFTSKSYSFTGFLNLAMTQDNFEKGITWIRSLLYNSVFTYERLNVIIQKVISSISQARRQGYAMAKCLSKSMLFNCTNHRMNTVLSQLKFLNELTKRLENENERDSVLVDLEKIRSLICSPEKMILHLSMNVGELTKKFKHPDQVLSKMIPQNAVPCQKRFPIQQDYEILSSAITNRHDKMKSCVVGMHTEDSAFMIHVTKSITDDEHPDVAPLLLYIEYISQLEGPLWRTVRGLGLAYGYSITLQPDQGTLSLLLYRASDIVQAFAKTKKIVFETLENEYEWNNLLFESGKNSLIFSIVNREGNISNVSEQSLLAHFRGYSFDYNRRLVAKIQAVNISLMKQVARKYMSPLFDPDQSLSTVVCHSSKYKEIAKSFADINHKLVEFSSLDESYLSPSYLENLEE